MIHLLCKEKYQSDGRSFGTAADPIDYSVVLLSTEGVLPSSYTEIEGQTSTPYDFAPGSLLIDTANRLKYIYDGQQWVFWSVSSQSGNNNNDDSNENDIVYVRDNEFSFNDLVQYINQGKKVALIESDYVFYLINITVRSEVYMAYFMDLEDLDSSLLDQAILYTSNTPDSMMYIDSDEDSTDPTIK